jgi:predicted phosphohydrolase
MSQNETVEDLDTTVTEEEVATSTDDNEEEDTTSDDEITWEEIARLRKAEESLKKANKKIAMLEKESKKFPESSESMPKTEAEYELWAERRDFYKSNATAKDMKEEIEAMVSASK